MSGPQFQPSGMFKPFKQWRVGIGANLNPDRRPGIDEEVFIFLEFVFEDGTREVRPFGIDEAELLREQLGERIAAFRARQN